MAAPPPPILLHPPSREQAAVVDALARDVNVLVASVAGSGKTSTALCFARACPAAKILLLTYNSRLKEETRERVLALGYSNVETHSYHSLGYRYYSEGCSKNLSDVVTHDVPPYPHVRLRPYTHVLIDEAQDITPVIFAFIVKVLRDIARANPSSPLPCFGVFGDALQAIYEFMESDARYLTHAPSIFPSNGRTWEHLTLRVSYRLPGNVAAFLNNAVLRQPGLIVPVKSAGAPVLYLRGSPWEISHHIAIEIAIKVLGCAAPAVVAIINSTHASFAKKEGEVYVVDLVELRGACDVVPCPGIADNAITRSALLKRLQAFTSTMNVGSKFGTPLIPSGLVAGLRYPTRAPTHAADDVMILSASIKESAKGVNTPFRQLENALAMSGIPIHIRDVDAAGNADVSRGKLLASTFCSSKGLERKLCFVMGFSSSFFTYFGKKPCGALKTPEEQRVCPNDVFVALSRSSEQLVVAAEGAEAPMPFLDIDQLTHPVVEVINVTHCKPRAEVPQLSDRRVLLVGGLLQHCTEIVLRTAMRGLSFELISPPGMFISVPTVVDGVGGSKESVSALTGLAIPAMLETARGNPDRAPECTMYAELQGALSKNLSPPLRARMTALPPLSRDAPPSYFLELAAPWSATCSIDMSGLLSPVLQQSRAYDWLSPHNAAACVTRLKERITDWRDAKFEQCVSIEYDHRGVLEFTVQGQMDVVTPSHVWEIKCVSGSLTDAHKLQLALYAWLLQMRADEDAAAAAAALADGVGAGGGGGASMGGGGVGSGRVAAPPLSLSFCLLNVLTGELWRFCPGDGAALNDAVRYLFATKYSRPPPCSDEVFIAQSVAAHVQVPLLAPPLSPPRLGGSGGAGGAASPSLNLQRLSLGVSGGGGGVSPFTDGAGAATIAATAPSPTPAGAASTTGGGSSPRRKRACEGGGGSDDEEPEEGGGGGLLSPPPKLSRKEGGA